MEVHVPDPFTEIEIEEMYDNAPEPSVTREAFRRRVREAERNARNPRPWGAKMNLLASRIAAMGPLDRMRLGRYLDEL